MGEAENGPGRRAPTLARTVAIVLAIAAAWPAAMAQQAARPGTPVPVNVARTVRQDVPYYLNGLGAVQAFASVLVRARVDGTLMQVTVAEGQEVKQGDVLAIIDPRPYQAALDAALAKRAQDEADLQNAKNDLVRYTSLAQNNFASRQQVDTQQAIVHRLTALLAADDAAISTARLNLGYCTITSPVQGRVGLRQVDAGNMVRSSDGSGIMTITQVQPISVVFTVPQDNLPRINQAMAGGKLQVTAFAADGKTELDQGTLQTPDNVIDSATGTIRLKATFPNQNRKLWPGQFVNARLLVSTDANVLTVPSVAVQHGPSGLYVYAVKPDSTVTRQPVEIMRDNGSVSIINKGLGDDETVVTQGQSRLQQGSRIAAREGGQSATTAANTGG